MLVRISSLTYHPKRDLDLTEMISINIVNRPFPRCNTAPLDVTLSPMRITSFITSILVSLRSSVACTRTFQSKCVHPVKSSLSVEFELET